MLGHVGLSQHISWAWPGQECREWIQCVGRAERERQLYVSHLIGSVDLRGSPGSILHVVLFYLCAHFRATGYVTCWLEGGKIKHKSEKKKMQNIPIPPARRKNENQKSTINMKNKCIHGSREWASDKLLRLNKLQIMEGKKLRCHGMLVFRGRKKWVFLCWLH